MTVDEIKQAIHKADLALRPNIVFVNPSDAKAIKEAFPEIEKMIVLQEVGNIESGKAFIMERKIFEKFANHDFGYAWSELGEESYVDQDTKQTENSEQ